MTTLKGVTIRYFFYISHQAPSQNGRVMVWTTVAIRDPMRVFLFHDRTIRMVIYVKDTLNQGDGMRKWRKKCKKKVTENIVKLSIGH